MRNRRRQRRVRPHRGYFLGLTLTQTSILAGLGIGVFCILLSAGLLVLSEFVQINSFSLTPKSVALHAPASPTSDTGNLAPSATPFVSTERVVVLPTATATAQAQPTKMPPSATPTAPLRAAESASGTTNSEGLAQITDPVTDETMSLQVADIYTGQPIEGIQLIYFSNGQSYIVEVVDPGHRYVSRIYEPPLNSATQHSGPPAALRRSPTIYIALILIELVSAVDDVMQLYEHPPRVEDWGTQWGWPYTDICVTGEQFSHSLAVELSVLGIFLPGWDKVGGRLLGVSDQLWLQMLKLSQIGADQSLSQAISAYSGVIRFRRFQSPIHIVVPFGTCLDPLNKADPISVISHLSYALKYNEVSLIPALIGNRGVSFGKFATDFRSPNYNNGERVTTILGQAASESPNLECLGYSMYVSVDQPRYDIVFRNLMIDWAGLNLPLTDLASFGVWLIDDQYELIYVAATPSSLVGPDSWTNPCPDI